MSKLQEMEEEYRELQETLRLRDMVAKLEVNPEFKRIIREKFCEEEAIRNLAVSTNPRLDPDARQQALEMAQASAYLKEFLLTFVQKGVQAENRLSTLREDMEELRTFSEGED